MARVLTDAEIAELLEEPKHLPAGWRRKLKPKDKAGARFRQRNLRIDQGDDRAFDLILRSSTLNPLDFSVILTYVELLVKETYILIRHNGTHSADHTNKLEHKAGLPGSRIRNCFHIHRATERYQLAGLSLDGFAEVTDAYNSFTTALEHMTASYGFVEPEGLGPSLFHPQGGLP